MLQQPRDPYVGIQIDGQYLIHQKLKAGGMGTVYQASQRLTRRLTAIKMLHPHLVDEMMIRRFEQEAVAISRLVHPNIVTVFGYGQHEGGPLYIAMEYIDGWDLESLINGNGPLSVAASLPLMLQMSEALAFAHEHNVIHRDIKPENIMVTQLSRRWLVKILDFGISKMLDSQTLHTRTGQLVGSPGYMSPEQWRQERDIDGRTDIYSLGLVFYFMLTGNSPFLKGDPVACMQAHLEEEVPPPSVYSPYLRQLPELDEVILKCVARDREGRYPNADALYDALVAVQRQVEARPDLQLGASRIDTPAELPYGATMPRSDPTLAAAPEPSDLAIETAQASAAGGVSPPTSNVWPKDPASTVASGPVPAAAARTNGIVAIAAAVAALLVAAVFALAYLSTDEEELAMRTGGQMVQQEIRRRAPSAPTSAERRPRLTQRSLEELQTPSRREGTSNTTRLARRESEPSDRVSVPARPSRPKRVKPKPPEPRLNDSW